MALRGDLDVMRELEERLFDRRVRGSPEAVAALLSEDFLEFGRSGGVYRKEEVVRSLAAESGHGASELTASGHEVRRLAEDVYLLTYRTVRKRKGAVALHTLRSSLWKCVDGRWTMVFHQGTPTTP